MLNKITCLSKYPKKNLSYNQYKTELVVGYYVSGPKNK